jgi:hypothetical protein
MGKEDDVFARLGPALADNALPGETINWRTPVRFDPTLLKKLITRHEQLQARVTTLAHEFKANRAEAWRVARDCATQLHELRRAEALWLYPVLARGLNTDATAWRQLVKLRFVMTGLARRLLRDIEQLAHATRLSSDITAAINAVMKALAEYRQRNESELYALYDLMDPGAPGKPLRVAAT